MIEANNNFFWEGEIPTLKTRTATNAKTSVFVICIKTVIYLLLYNLYDCIFNTLLNIYLSLARSFISCSINVTRYVRGFRFTAFCPEAAAQKYSLKKMFLEISQNSQENPCARVFF